MNWSDRAKIVYMRTYSRPAAGGGYETWDQTIDRVVGHQRWLWERQLGGPITAAGEAELAELRQLMLDRKVLLAGRTMWLGGTEKAKAREVSQFNCAFTTVRNVHDMVDSAWLLFNGCGVGFKPTPGTLNGFLQPISEIEVVRSARTSKGGRETNVETFEDGVWTISFGDSGEAWAKAIGKLMAGKYPARKLVFDLSQIRPAGSRLTGYGWLSSGDDVLAQELPKMAAILNRRAGRMLTAIDILDMENHIGVIQTGRRGAEIAVMDYGDAEWRLFATAKKEYWKTGNSQRSQSNNSLLFHEQPSQSELKGIFDLMHDAGGSEPGFINYAALKQRAPYASGFNPCVEAALADKGFCNLVVVNVAAFTDILSLRRAVYVVARANYRQTLVNLDDGILQRAWHENNQFIRLCGVSLTGQAMRPDLTPYDYKTLKNAAISGAYSMAGELGTQLPANVTLGKPEGSLAKVMDATEGIHTPLGRYIFNNITFTKHDPLLPALVAAGYRVFDNPLQPDGVCVAFPVEWSTVPFSDSPNGPVNTQTAVEQLDRYKMMMDNYVEQNQSITVSYSPDETPEIIDWLGKNWEHYVGVSFVYRTDPTKTAEDLGYPFLPQEVVTEKEFRAYASKLKSVDPSAFGSTEELGDDGCATGVCPVR